MNSKCIDCSRIIIFTGDFGSGKTMLALNYARYLASTGKHVGLIDADSSKACYRLRDILSVYPHIDNVTLLSPLGKVADTDIPSLSHVWAALQSNMFPYLVFDLPGEYKGAVLLKSIRTMLKDSYELLYVINICRPFGGNLEEIVAQIEKLQYYTEMRFTGLVANTNLGRQTTEDVIVKGFAAASEVSRVVGIPVKLIGVPKDIKVSIIDWNGQILEIFLLDEPYWVS
ncbi:MAG: hypothetical protein NUV45_08990 [Tepidanaerobacteraceae bacterium]|jgi:GTPase SAR1 family protein|nr:hypothetical protein [Tepidanaerobacteraceae bacterium]